MTHHQHNHEHHHYPHDGSTEMGMEEKLTKLLEHWMKHGEEHAKTYELWAERAKSHGVAQLDILLEKAAKKTRAINEDFKAAISVLKNKGCNTKGEG